MYLHSERTIDRIIYLDEYGQCQGCFWCHRGLFEWKLFHQEKKQSGIAMFDILKEGDFKFEFSGFGKNRGIWTFTRENIQPSSIRTKTSHVLSVAYFGGS